MTELPYIGAEVGLADDSERRGVVVDSHPEDGWLVWWCGWFVFCAIGLGREIVKFVTRENP